MSDIQWYEAVLEGSALDGIFVRFKCWYWAKDVNVEMIEPYSGETAGIHMPYMVPATYLENNRWQDAAWGLVREILERMAWKQNHASEVADRLRERERRLMIVEKLSGVLEGKKRKLNAERKNGFVAALAFQARLRPLNKALKELDGIVLQEREEHWLCLAMRGALRFKLLSPYPSREADRRNVRVYSRPKHRFIGDPEGWQMRFEGTVAKADFPQMGIGVELSLDVECPDLCAVHALDVVKFAEYLHQLDDAKGYVLDAWIEIDGRDSEWCVTIRRSGCRRSTTCSARRNEKNVE